MPVEADGRSLRDRRRAGRRPEELARARGIRRWQTPQPPGPSSRRRRRRRPDRPERAPAFDIEDADFFLTLVPGPRDRDGLPESIRAWKRRIEEPDPARSFAVGLLYGPSGSGKSSFVKAGLLPRLAPRSGRSTSRPPPSGTEARLLAALSREFPDLPEGCGLAEAAAAIREGRPPRGGSKVLLVLDQFEQWLHGHPDETDGDMVRALRHCDGAGLQALLLVRDDFWMAITRFLRTLEVRPIEGPTPRPSSRSTPATPAACWPSWAAPSDGSTTERARKRPGSSSRPSRSWPGPTAASSPSG